MTIDLKDLGWGLLCIAALVLLIYGSVLIKHLIVTVKRTNKILADTETVTGIAAKRAEEMDEAIGDVAESLSNAARAIKGKQSVIGAITSMVKAIASLKDILNKKSDK